MKRIIKKENYILLALVLLYVLASYFAGIYSEGLEKSVFLKGPYGWISYTAITALAVFVAPVSTLPLMPFAVKIWGPLPTALMSIFGWTLGASMVFYVSRKFGKKIIRKFFDIKRIEKVADAFPKKNLFFLVVIARIVLPVDVLSYALGLFTNMKTFSYIMATFLGVVPFAVVFVYLTEIPIVYQLIAGLVILVLLTLVRPWSLKKRSRKIINI